MTLAEFLAAVPLPPSRNVACRAVCAMDCALTVGEEKKTAYGWCMVKPICLQYARVPVCAKIDAVRAELVRFSR